MASTIWLLGGLKSGGSWFQASQIKHFNRKKLSVVVCACHPQSQEEA
jgi:hypothetical protein